PAPATPPAPTSQPLFNTDLGERLLAYVATLNLPQAQIDQAAESIQARFGFNPAAVTRDALNTNQRQWETTIRQETGLTELTPAEDRTEFATVYPQRVCLAQAPGPIRIGALVNPDGSWRGEPALLRSSGYGALDRKALQEIQTHRFEPADGIRAYLLTVNTSVDYGRRPCLGPEA
ncbi:MAG TPA: energy transducer TonB, partial [Nodosilinea sp.]|nr:energy transducer TonB [Nodosilinea sp.]